VGVKLGMISIENHQLDYQPQIQGTGGWP